MNERARLIASRFGAAVDTYDTAARVQAAAAARLAGHLRGAYAREPRTILEFGCGTGLMTAHLRRLWPAARIVVSDLAPAMARRCVAKYSGAAVAMDAESPCFVGGAFDLVCGSLAAQWFAHPEDSVRGLQRLVAPRGMIALATLGPATLGEWHAARAATGLPPGGLDYLSLDRLAATQGRGMRRQVAVREMLRDPIPDARAFLAGLRAIGADGARPGDVPAGHAALRRAMRMLEASANAVTYEVLTVIWERISEESD